MRGSGWTAEKSIPLGLRLLQSTDRYYQCRSKQDNQLCTSLAFEREVFETVENELKWALLTLQSRKERSRYMLEQTEIKFLLSIRASSICSSFLLRQRRTKISRPSSGGTTEKQPYKSRNAPAWSFLLLYIQLVLIIERFQIKRFTNASVQPAMADNSSLQDFTVLIFHRAGVKTKVCNF